MKLTVLAPHRIVLDGLEVSSVVAEGLEGSFGVLPRHVDYAAVLRPGIVTFLDPEGEEGFVGTDRGILVKRGPDVSVSVRDAIRGASLETLRGEVASRFLEVDERERQARSALATLEARFLRRFMEQARRAAG